MPANKSTELSLAKSSISPTTKPNTDEEKEIYTKIFIDLLKKETKFYNHAAIFSLVGPVVAFLCLGGFIASLAIALSTSVSGVGLGFGIAAMVFGILGIKMVLSTVCAVEDLSENYKDKILRDVLSKKQIDYLKAHPKPNLRLRMSIGEAEKWIAKHFDLKLNDIYSEREIASLKAELQKHHKPEINFEMKVFKGMKLLNRLLRSDDSKKAKKKTGSSSVISLENDKEIMGPSSQLKHSLTFFDRNKEDTAESSAHHKKSLSRAVVTG